MKMYQPSREQYLSMLAEEFKLSGREAKRIADFSVGIKDWSVIALSAKKLLMVDFRNGDISFHSMLEVMRHLSLGLPPSNRLHYLGTLAEFGLKTSQKAKEAKRGKKTFPLHPPWFKRTVVDLFDMVKSVNPKLVYFAGSDDSVYNRTSHFLAPLNINLPTEKAVEGWLRERQNKDVQEYRNSKKTRIPNPESDF